MKRKVFLLLIAVLGVVSCSNFSYLLGIEDGGEETSSSTVSLTPGKTILGADAGTLLLVVNTKSKWTLSASYASGSAWGTLDKSSGTGPGQVNFTYTANTTGSNRIVGFLLTDKGSSKTVSITITQQYKNAVVTDSYGNYDSNPFGWLELPECKSGDGKSLLPHDNEGGRYKSRSQSGVRNWTAYWDYNAHLAQWVAYPLNKVLKGSGERTNQWGLDPLVPSSLQPNLTNGSYGGGWTRGHQIPSADRLNTNANVSTFYATNMTPQDYDFNSGIWGALEGKVRTYSEKADTLYVVTGCCYDKSTSTSGGNSGFAVKIPTHYFKALLYKGSSSYAYDTGGYIAAGFYLPHSTSISGGNPMDYICTVDELEEYTGIDFFPLLESVIGHDKATKAESEIQQFWRN